MKENNRRLCRYFATFVLGLGIGVVLQFIDPWTSPWIFGGLTGLCAGVWYALPWLDERMEARR